MKISRIVEHLGLALDRWLATVTDKELAERAKEGAIITGGSIASLVGGSEVNDYDIYFDSQKLALDVANYYCQKVHGPGKWTNIGKETNILGEQEDRVFAKVGSNYPNRKGPRKPDHIHISPAAITLGSKVQLIFRFYGSPQEIHRNFDFVHATNYFYKGELKLNETALSSIATKQLYYNGSLYPICSIMRAMKFIKRGWSISQGQILRMIRQATAVDFASRSMLRDQLFGVDSSYFLAAIEMLEAADAQNEGEGLFDRILDMAFGDSLEVRYVSKFVDAADKEPRLSEADGLVFSVLGCGIIYQGRRKLQAPYERVHGLDNAVKRAKELYSSGMLPVFKLPKGSHVFFDTNNDVLFIARCDRFYGGTESQETIMEWLRKLSNGAVDRNGSVLERLQVGGNTLWNILSGVLSVSRQRSMNDYRHLSDIALVLDCQKFWLENTEIDELPSYAIFDSESGLLIETFVEHSFLGPVGSDALSAARKAAAARTYSRLKEFDLELFRWDDGMFHYWNEALLLPSQEVYGYIKSQKQSAVAVIPAATEEEHPVYRAQGYLYVAQHRLFY